MRGVALTLGGLLAAGLSTYFSLGGLLTTLAVLTVLVGLLDVLSSMGQIWRK